MNQVADSVDVRYIGLVVFVNRNPLGFVQFDSCLIKAKSLCAGFAAGSNQNLVAGQRLFHFPFQLQGDALLTLLHA